MWGEGGALVGLGDVYFAQGDYIHASENYQQVLSSNFLYEGGFVLPPGKYKLKAVVRENESGKMGTFEEPLVLPQIGQSGLALSSVIVSNELQGVQTGAKGEKRKANSQSPNPLQLGNGSLLPSVTRVFRNNQNLYVYLESYTPKPSSKGASQATAAGSDGQAPAIPPPPSVALVFFRSGRKISEAGPFPGKM